VSERVSVTADGCQGAYALLEDWIIGYRLWVGHSRVNMQQASHAREFHWPLVGWERAESGLTWRVGEDDFHSCRRACWIWCRCRRTTRP
jgi:hypothetical protein